LRSREIPKTKPKKEARAKKRRRRNAQQAFGTASEAYRNSAFGRGPNPERVKAILHGLDEAYPAASCALKHDNPFQLLISTILSAQCTDERVNMVTPGLFKKYPTPATFAYANPRDIEEEIRSTGFYRNKTKSILGASKKIVEEFGGEVPRTMEQILTLPGVARKTGNVVLGTAYGIASGVVVDTHVQRLSGRLDLTKNTDPKKIETDLMKVIPEDRWILFSHQLIWHGRRICKSRKPLCIECIQKNLPTRMTIKSNARKPSCTMKGWSLLS
jgi:endonuclease-3